MTKTWKNQIELLIYMGDLLDLELGCLFQKLKIIVGYVA